MRRINGDAELRIGIDGLHLFGAYSGVQNAQARTIEALRAQYPQDHLTLYAPRDFKGPPAAAEEDQGLQIRRTWFKGRRRIIRTLWRNFRLQPNAYNDKCELLHGATYSLPSTLSMPAVLTLHDCIALSHPQFATPGSAKVQKRQLPKSAKLARRVMVPTEAVKAEALRLLDLKPEKIDVVPWGVGPEFKPIEDETLLEQAQKQWGLPDSFVLYVGTLEPKKNLKGLLRSFVAAKLNSKLPHALVIVGRNGWGVKDFPRDIHDHGARDYVFLTGYVPDQALPLLYSLADLCVLPSHIEGFGMPVLEAMACGCPVMVSDAPALVEVAGGAARVCRVSGEKPYQELREAFEELLGQKTSEKARYALRGRGLQRVKQFTWQKTAELTHKCYESALT